MIREWGHGISIAIGTNGKPFAIVCIDAASFVRHGAEVLRSYPATTLDVGNVGPHAAELVALPEVQRMTRLVLHDLGDAGAAVVGGARLAVRELVAVECGLTRVDLLQPLAAQLDVLELSKNAIGNAGAHALARLDRLVRLALFGCQLNDDGIAALAAATFAVKSLDLGGDYATHTPWRNRITATGAGALAAAAWVAHVEQLRLAGTSLGDEGVTALAKLPAPGPIELDLRHNLIESPAAVAALAAAPWTRLTKIGLTGNLLHGEATQDSFDYDGSVVARVPVALKPEQLAERFGRRVAVF